MNRPEDEIQDTTAMALEEHERLTQEARDACASQMVTAASVSSSDAALTSLKHRLRAIDGLSTETLVAKAQARKQRPA